MKRGVVILTAAVLLAACTNTEEQLKQRANELCAYIPDHQLLEKSRDYMTTDFYAVLDTMFYRLPEHEAMDHEWLYYFVTGNGGTIADYEVLSVEKTDATHAVATILVRQVWQEGIVGEEEDEPEEHRLYMERVNGQWLMSDFDEHKADCIRFKANNRKEQAFVEAAKEIGWQDNGYSYFADLLNGTSFDASEVLPSILKEEDRHLVSDYDASVYSDIRNTYFTTGTTPLLLFYVHDDPWSGNIPANVGANVKTVVNPIGRHSPYLNDPKLCPEQTKQEVMSFVTTYIQ